MIEQAKILKTVLESSHKIKSKGNRVLSDRSPDRNRVNLPLPNTENNPFLGSLKARSAGGDLPDDLQPGHLGHLHI